MLLNKSLFFQKIQKFFKTENFPLKHLTSKLNKFEIVEVTKKRNLRCAIANIASYELAVLWQILETSLNDRIGFHTVRAPTLARCDLFAAREQDERSRLLRLNRLQMRSKLSQAVADYCVFRHLIRYFYSSILFSNSFQR